MRASLVALDGSTSDPPNLSGYQTWKEAFDQGKAGVWSIPLSESVAAMEKTLNQ